MSQPRDAKNGKKPEKISRRRLNKREGARLATSQPSTPQKQGAGTIDWAPSTDTLRDMIHFTLKKIESTDPAGFDAFFEKAWHCKKAQKKTVTRQQTGSSRTRTTVQTYTLSPNERQRLILFLMMETQIRAAFAPFDRLSDDDKATAISNFLPQIDKDTAVIADWLGRLSVKDIVFFARDQLVPAPIRTLALELARQTKEQDVLLNPEITLFPPQISAINPLIPTSQRQSILKDHGLHTLDIAYVAERKQAYPMTGSIVNWGHPIAVDFEKGTKSGCFTVTGYYKETPDDDNHKAQLILPPKPTSQIPIKFVNSHKTDLKADAVRWGYELFHTAACVPIQNTLTNPNDYAFKTHFTPTPATFDDLPRMVTDPRHFIFQQLYDFLIRGDTETIFGPQERFTLRPLFQKGASASRGSDEKRLMFLSLLMQPELMGMAERFDSIDDTTRAAFKAMLADMFAPLLANKQRLLDMGRTAQVLGAMSHDEIGFWAADPALSPMIKSQISRFLDSIGKGYEAVNNSRYFDNDPRLSLINPLIPKEERDRLQAETKIQRLEGTIVKIEGATLTLQRRGILEFHRAIVGGKIGEFNVGDHIEATLVTTTVRGKPVTLLPSDKLPPVIMALKEKGQLNKHSVGGGAEKKFSLFDTVDETITHFKTIMGDSLDTSFGFRSTLRCIDPHHILGFAVRQNSSALLQQAKNNVLSVLEPLDHDGRHPSLIQDLSRAVAMGTPGVFYTASTQDPRKTEAYVIPLSSFMPPLERLCKLSHGALHSLELREDVPAAIIDPCDYYMMSLVAADIANPQSHRRKQGLNREQGSNTTSGPTPYDTAYAMLRTVTFFLEKNVDRRSAKNVMDRLRQSKSPLDEPELKMLRPLLSVLLMRDNKNRDPETPLKTSSLDMFHRALNIGLYFGSGDLFTRKDFTGPDFEHRLANMARQLEIHERDKSGYDVGSRAQLPQLAQNLLYEFRELYCVSDENEIAVKISIDAHDGTLYMDLGQNPNNTKTERLMGHFNARGFDTEMRSNSATGTVRLVLKPVGNQPR